MGALSRKIHSYANQKCLCVCLHVYTYLHIHIEYIYTKMSAAEREKYCVNFSMEEEEIFFFSIFGSMKVLGHITGGYIGR